MSGVAAEFLESWADTVGKVNSTGDLLGWIKKLNENTHVNVRECNINDSSFWFYDDYNGEILNRKRSFFSISGLRRFENNQFIEEQPIIIQPEIGYLGIICKKIEGIMHFLMQAKIEPGNVNCVQLSPTIQATKSNFTRAHGGRMPAYFSYFEKVNPKNVIYDQIQSEQASRFYKKRNRNMIIEIQGDIEVLSNFQWMTLGQIKELMNIDNLVNMDTRTVLAGIPLITERYTDGELIKLRKWFTDEGFYKSIFETSPAPTLVGIYQAINDFKMFRDLSSVRVPLNQLVDWETDEYGITCKKHAAFMVRYYNIEIGGREVQNWIQPLFKPIGTATFGLIIKNTDSGKKYLVKLKSEIGTFDKIEIGPGVQLEATHYLYNDDEVEKLFRSRLEMKKKCAT